MSTALFSPVSVVIRKTRPGIPRVAALEGATSWCLSTPAVGRGWVRPGSPSASDTRCRSRYLSSVHHEGPDWIGRARLRSSCRPSHRKPISARATGSPTRTVSRSSSTAGESLSINETSAKKGTYRINVTTPITAPNSRNRRFSRSVEARLNLGRVTSRGISSLQLQYVLLLD
jgi:hypothetical protein